MPTLLRVLHSVAANAQAPRPFLWHASHAQVNCRACISKASLHLRLLIKHSGLPLHPCSPGNAPAAQQRRLAQPSISQQAQIGSSSVLGHGAAGPAASGGRDYQEEEQDMSEGGYEEDDPELAAAIAASLEDAVARGGSGAGAGGGSQLGPDTSQQAEEEMCEQEEPAAGPGTCRKCPGW